MKWSIDTKKFPLSIPHVHVLLTAILEMHPQNGALYYLPADWRWINKTASRRIKPPGRIRMHICRPKLLNMFIYESNVKVYSMSFMLYLFYVDDF